MTNRELREFLLGRTSIEEVWQDRPYTAVRVAVGYNGRLHTAYGFSKVCYPDEWDKDFGIKLAVKRAVAKVAKRIREGEDAT